MTQTIEIPTTKTGLRKLALATLIGLAAEMKLETEGKTKPEVIDAILAKQAETEQEYEGQGLPEVTEADRESAAPILDTERDGVEDAEEEPEMEIPETPKSLSALPTWIYFVSGQVEASTNQKRAYGAACRAVGRTPTATDYERVSQGLKTEGSVTVEGAEKSTTIFRARAI